MTDQPDLIAWLRNVLDEEATSIDLISPGGYEPDTWETRPIRNGRWAHLIAKSRTIDEPAEAAVDEGGEPVAILQTGRNEHHHIERYDPQRMHAEVAAKRALLDLHAQPHECVAWDRDETCTGYFAPGECLTVRLLAQPYADREGYREEWRP